MTCPLVSPDPWQRTRSVLVNVLARESRVGDSDAFGVSP